MFRLSRARRQSRAVVSGAARPGSPLRCCWCSFVRLKTGPFPSLAFVGPLAAGLRIGPRVVALTPALSAVCGAAPVRFSSDPYTRSRPFIQGVVTAIIDCGLGVSSVEGEAPESSSCQWRRRGAARREAAGTSVRRSTSFRRSLFPCTRPCQQPVAQRRSDRFRLSSSRSRPFIQGVVIIIIDCRAECFVCRGRGARVEQLSVAPPGLGRRSAVVGARSFDWRLGRSRRSRSLVRSLLD